MLEDILITKEQKLEIDLHDMQLEEAKYYLDRLFLTLPDNIKQITVIHGYRKGQILLNMVRKEFKNEKIKQKVIPLNKGTTIFYLY